MRFTNVPLRPAVGHVSSLVACVARPRDGCARPRSLKAAPFPGTQAETGVSAYTLASRDAVFTSPRRKA
jgi:hypothetical protein